MNLNEITLVKYTKSKYRKYAMFGAIIVVLASLFVTSILYLEATSISIDVLGAERFNERIADAKRYGFIAFLIMTLTHAFIFILLGKLKHKDLLYETFTGDQLTAIQNVLPSVCASVFNFKKDKYINYNNDNLSQLDYECRIYNNNTVLYVTPYALIIDRGLSVQFIDYRLVESITELKKHSWSKGNTRMFRIMTRDGKSIRLHTGIISIDMKNLKYLLERYNTKIEVIVE